MFNGEPRSYTRFSLAQNTDADNSQVEMKLSANGDEEIMVQEDGHAPNTYTQRPLSTYRNVVFAIVGTLAIFILGYLVGYVTHHKPKEEISTCPPMVTSQSNADEAAPPPSLSWTDMNNLLQQRLTTASFSEKLGMFTLPRPKSHVAGDDGDNTLANKVLTAFKSFGMDPWTNEHSVKLPQQSSENPNEVRFGEEVIGTPKGFLAYSEVGTRTGPVVYANYGQMGDLKECIRNGIKLSGSVLLLRAGKISYAEKAANAAKWEAVAVLIYPDSGDLSDSTELYGHVHMGSGDPYTPGFPSFEHTQFSPTNSSGLQPVLAQTITSSMARKIFQKMGGRPAPDTFKGSLRGLSYKLGGVNDTVTVTVNNVLVDTPIHNVFGVIKGNEEPDRYVIIGAQRDAFGPGMSKSTVGTTLLVELARAVTEMIRQDHLSLRRSLVFASWSAGEYGSVGATEWQEGYLPSLFMKAVTYINLDGVVTGRQELKASASPLLTDLLIKTLKQVKSPFSEGNVFEKLVQTENNLLEPMSLDNTAYTFLALSGIPSVSFCFRTKDSDYPYLGTELDSYDHLNYATGQKLNELAVAAGQVAGQMALRLAHDHLLPLSVQRYNTEIRKRVSAVGAKINQLSKVNSFLVPSTRWLYSAVGAYGRASRGLLESIENSDLEDKEMRRMLNDRLIKVEHNLLSPYVSVRDAPFRHILFGSGDHTMKTLEENVNVSDRELFLNQFALATWTLQSCANDLMGPVWVMDNEI